MARGLYKICGVKKKPPSSKKCRIAENSPKKIVKKNVPKKSIRSQSCQKQQASFSAPHEIVDQDNSLERSVNKNVLKKRIRSQLSQEQPTSSSAPGEIIVDQDNSLKRSVNKNVLKKRVRSQLSQEQPTSSSAPGEIVDQENSLKISVNKNVLKKRIRSQLSQEQPASSSAPAKIVDQENSLERSVNKNVPKKRIRSQLSQVQPASSSAPGEIVDQENTTKTRRGQKRKRESDDYGINQDTTQEPIPKKKGRTKKGTKVSLKTVANGEPLQTDSRIVDCDINSQEYISQEPIPKKKGRTKKGTKVSLKTVANGEPLQTDSRIVDCDINSQEYISQDPNPKKTGRSKMDTKRSPKTVTIRRPVQSDMQHVNHDINSKEYISQDPIPKKRGRPKKGTKVSVKAVTNGEPIQTDLQTADSDIISLEYILQDPAPRKRGRRKTAIKGRPAQTDLQYVDCDIISQEYSLQDEQQISFLPEHEDVTEAITDPLNSTLVIKKDESQLVKKYEIKEEEVEINDDHQSRFEPIVPLVNSLPHWTQEEVEIHEVEINSKPIVPLVNSLPLWTQASVFCNNEEPVMMSSLNFSDEIDSYEDSGADVGLETYDLTEDGFSDDGYSNSENPTSSSTAAAYIINEPFENTTTDENLLTAEANKEILGLSLYDDEESVSSSCAVISNTNDSFGESAADENLEAFSIGEEGVGLSLYDDEESVSSSCAVISNTNDSFGESAADENLEAFSIGEEGVDLINGETNTGRIIKEKKEPEQNTSTLKLKLCTEKDKKINKTFPQMFSSMNSKPEKYTLSEDAVSKTISTRTIQNSKRQTIKPNKQSVSNHGHETWKGLVEGTRLFVKIQKRDPTISTLRACFCTKKLNVVLDTIKEMIENDKQDRCNGSPLYVALSWFFNTAGAEVIEEVNRKSLCEEEKSTKIKDINKFLVVIKNNLKSIVPMKKHSQETKDDTASTKADLELNTMDDITFSSRNLPSTSSSDNSSTRNCSLENNNRTHLLGKDKDMTAKVLKKQKTATHLKPVKSTWNKKLMGCSKLSKNLVSSSFGLLPPNDKKSMSLVRNENLTREKAEGKKERVNPSEGLGSKIGLETVYPSTSSSEKVSTYPSTSSSEKVSTYPSTSSSEKVSTYPSTSSSEKVSTYPSTSSSEKVSTYPSTSSSEKVSTYPSTSSSEKVSTYPSTSSSEKVSTYPSTSSSEKVSTYPSKPENKRLIKNEIRQNKNDQNLNPFSKTSRKLNNCLLCKTLVTDFHKHLVQVHKDNESVIQYKGLLNNRSSEKEWDNIFNGLRLTGSNIRNSELIKYAMLRSKNVKGLLKARELTKEGGNKICLSCKCFFNKKSFYKHNCNKTDGNIVKDHNSKEESVSGVKICKIKTFGVEPIADVTNEEDGLINDYISYKLKNHAVTKLALNDPFFMSIIRKYKKKYQNKKNENYMLRKIKLGCDFLLKLKLKDCSIQSLFDCFDPSKKEIASETIKELCKFNETTGRIGVGSMPSRLLVFMRDARAQVLSDVTFGRLSSNERKTEYIRGTDEILNLLLKLNLLTKSQNETVKQRPLKDTINTNVKTDLVDLIENTKHSLKKSTDDKTQREFISQFASEDDSKDASNTNETTDFVNLIEDSKPALTKSTNDKTQFEVSSDFATEVISKDASNTNVNTDLVSLIENAVPLHNNYNDDRTKCVNSSEFVTETHSEPALTKSPDDKTRCEISSDFASEDDSIDASNTNVNTDFVNLIENAESSYNKCYDHRTKCVNSSEFVTEIHSEPALTKSPDDKTRCEISSDFASEDYSIDASNTNVNTDFVNLIENAESSYNKCYDHRTKCVNSSEIVTEKNSKPALTKSTTDKTQSEISSKFVSEYDSKDSSNTNVNTNFINLIKNSKHALTKSTGDKTQSEITSEFASVGNSSTSAESVSNLPVTLKTINIHPKMAEMWEPEVSSVNSVNKTMKFAKESGTQIPLKTAEEFEHTKPSNEEGSSANAKLNIMSFEKERTCERTEKLIGVGDPIKNNEDCEDNEVIIDKTVLKDKSQDVNPSKDLESKKTTSLKVELEDRDPSKHTQTTHSNVFSYICTFCECVYNEELFCRHKCSKANRRMDGDDNINRECIRKNIGKKIGDCDNKRLSEEVKQNNCKVPINSGRHKTTLNIVSQGRRINYIKEYGIPLGPAPTHLPQASSELIDFVYPRLSKDDVSSLALNDPLLISTASSILERQKNLGKSRDLGLNLTAKFIRDGGEFLRCAQSQDKAITQFRDLLHPSKINTVFETAKELCGLDEKNGKIKKISKPFRITYVINQAVGQVLKETLVDSSLSESDKIVIKKDIEQFLDLKRSKFRSIIVRWPASKKPRRGSTSSESSEELSDDTLVGTSSKPKKIPTMKKISNKSGSVGGKDAIRGRNISTSSDSEESSFDESETDLTLPLKYENEGKPFQRKSVMSDNSISDPTSKAESHAFKKKRWTEKQKRMVILNFKEFIRNGTNPGRKRCRELIASCEELTGRSADQVNLIIDNINKGKLKLPPEFKHLKSQHDC